MIWLLLVIGIFVGDGLCKTYMDRSLQEKEQRPVLGGHVILRKFHNPGAMLGWDRTEGRCWRWSPG